MKVAAKRTPHRSHVHDADRSVEAVGESMQRSLREKRRIVTGTGTGAHRKDQWRSVARIPPHEHCTHWHCEAGATIWCVTSYGGVPILDISVDRTWGRPVVSRERVDTFRNTGVG